MLRRVVRLGGVFPCLIISTAMQAEAQNVIDWSLGEIVDDRPSEKLDGRFLDLGEDVSTSTPLPTSVDDENYLAAVLACGERDQPARAVKNCTAVIELTPNEATYFVSRGMAYLGLKNLEAAEVDFEQAVKLDFMPARARYILGYGLIEVGLYEKAIVQLSKYLEEMPNSSMGYSERSYAYGALGQDERALADLDRAIELDPNNQGALKARATRLAIKGQTEAAIADMPSAAKVAGEVAAQANVMLAAKRFSDAIVLFSKVLEETPDDVDSLIGRGASFMEAGLLEPAERDFSDALQYDPDNHHALWRRAVILSMLGRLEEAEADARKAIEVAPTYGHTHFALAAVAFKRQNFPDAIGSLDRAIQLPPGGDTGLLHHVLRGSIYRRLGKLTLAMDDLNRALEINPTSTKALFRTRVCFCAAGGHRCCI